MHARRRRAADTDWRADRARSTTGSPSSTPSPVVELNRAVAVAMADGPGARAGADRRDRRASTATTCCHAARADLLRRLGRAPRRRRAYERALELAGTRSSGPSSSGAWPRCRPANLAADANHTRGTRGDPRQALGGDQRASLATACLGEAFELLDDAGAERLEDQLFRPVQRAYAHAKRAQASFADRVGLVAPASGSPSAGPPSQGPKLLVERAAGAAAEADLVVADLQDSMLPIEAGDAELRAALAEVRELLGDGPAGGA